MLTSCATPADTHTEGRLLSPHLSSPVADSSLILLIGHSSPVEKHPLRNPILHRQSDVVCHTRFSATSAATVLLICAMPQFTWYPTWHHHSHNALGAHLSLPLFSWALRRQTVSRSPPLNETQGNFHTLYFYVFHCFEPHMEVTNFT